MTKKKIVLIDDDALFLMLTRKLLAREPYLDTIEAFSSVEESVAYFQELMESGEHFPDAVFIDLDMPQMDGLELAEKLQDMFFSKRAAGGASAGRASTKVYILSSSISQRDRQIAEKLSAVTDYMEKRIIIY